MSPKNQLSGHEKPITAHSFVSFSIKTLEFIKITSASGTIFNSTLLYIITFFSFFSMFLDLQFLFSVCIYMYCVLFSHIVSSQEKKCWKLPLPDLLSPSNVVPGLSYILTPSQQLLDSGRTSSLVLGIDEKELNHTNQFIMFPESPASRKL